MPKARDFLTPAGEALLAKSWYDPRTWIGSSDGQSQAELQAASDAADARLAELNQGSRARYGEAWYAQAEANRTAAVIDVPGSINEDFNRGAAEGYSNVTGAISTGLNAPFRFLWDAVPKWLWLVALLALFLYLGGGVVIRRKVASL
jgi:hypothetical protein